jgi:alkylation response protein AidB-like acyl-CoA dehydrogenase
VDVTLTDEQADFQQTIRRWLQSNVPDRPLAPASTKEGVKQRREWERRLFDAGYAAVHWPIAHGGLGLDPLSTALFYDEYVRAGGPDRLNRLALGLAGPTLISHGTQAQQQRWLEGMLTCDELWCQGFSEPDAGSDLAALRTRGVIDGPDLVINGQKIWTSHSRFADWIFALVRTDPTAPKHKGITFVIIDRHAPGVEVRPIRQLNHASDFGEVFFTDVRVPLDQVVGQLNNGWRVAMTTLTNERSSNLNTAAHFQRLLDEVIAHLPAERLEDRRTIAQLGQFHEEIEAYRYLTLRTLSETTHGRAPGPQAFMGKLWWSEMQNRIQEFASESLGPEAEALDASEWNRRIFQDYWLGRAALIYAGSNEIQRNIIAERVLGLPKGR